MSDLTSDPQPVWTWAETTDYIVDACFDAAPWLTQASDEEILRLAADEWAGPVAHEIARWTSAHAFQLGLDSPEADELDELFEYIAMVVAQSPLEQQSDPIGFSCVVDEKEALAWVATNRPGLYQRITEVN